MIKINIKDFRKLNGLTQEELGKFLDVKKAFISSMETGRCSMPKEKLQKILNNDMGWDISPIENSLTEVPMPVAEFRTLQSELLAARAELSLVKKELEMLKGHYSKIEKERDEYLAIILSQVKNHNNL